ncbi:hypothetical protein DPSP01_003037 [Paraphaeosphaeria sporulosa]
MQFMAGYGGAMIAGSSRICSPISWTQPSPAQASDLTPAFARLVDAMTSYRTRRTATFSVAVAGLFRKEQRCKPLLFYDVISTSQLFAHCRGQSVAIRTVPPSSPNMLFCANYHGLPQTNLAPLLPFVR